MAEKYELKMRKLRHTREHIGELNAVENQVAAEKMSPFRRCP